MPQTSAMSYIRQGTTPFFRLPTIDVDAASPYAGLRRSRPRHSLGHVDHLPPRRPLRPIRGAARERARAGLPPLAQGRRLRRAPRGRRRKRRQSPLRSRAGARRHRERDRVGGRCRSCLVRRGWRPFRGPAGDARRREEARASRGRARRRPSRHERRRGVGRRFPPRNAAAPRHRRGPRRARTASPGRRARAVGVPRGGRARRGPRRDALRRRRDRDARHRLRRAAHRGVRGRPAGVRDVRRRRRRSGVRPWDRHCQCPAASRRARRSRSCAGSRACTSSAWTWSRSARRSTTRTSRATSRRISSSKAWRSPRSTGRGRAHSRESADGGDCVGCATSLGRYRCKSGLASVSVARISRRGRLRRGVVPESPRRAAQAFAWRARPSRVAPFVATSSGRRMARRFFSPA